MSVYNTPPRAMRELPFPDMEEDAAAEPVTPESVACLLCLDHFALPQTARN